MAKKGGGKGGKDPFKLLRQADKDFMDAVDGMSAEEAKARIGKVALDQASFDAAEEVDGDLAEKKERLAAAQEAAKHAARTYTDGRKVNRQRIQYARKRLIDLGKL